MANNAVRRRKSSKTLVLMTPAIKMKQAFDLANEAYQEELADLKGEIKRIKPKAEAYDAFLDVDKFSNFRDASKLIGCSQKKLMALLMDGKYIYKNDHDEYRCYAEHAECFALRPYKNGKHYGKQLMLTIAGVNFFRNIVAEQDNERRRKNHRDAIESIEYIFSL